MGQILHGCAKTTEAVRRAIQNSQESLKSLAGRYGINPKTVSKWRKRLYVSDSPMGPKEARSTVLSLEEEALCVAFRKHTLLPLDDCLYALQATIPHLNIDVFTGMALIFCQQEKERALQRKNSKPILLAIFTSISRRYEREKESSTFLWLWIAPQNLFTWNY